MARFILGVTGNIATGKSTVVNMLVEKGAHHIDSDVVYHDLIAPGTPLLQTLVDHFGNEILSDGGSLNRKTLGAIVFSDAAQLEQLDRLTHPVIIAEADRRAVAIEEGVVILDAVKLIESGHAEVCDAVWLVTAPEDVQIQRLMKRNSLTVADARTRVEAQPPVATKIDCVDLVINNDGLMSDLQRQVDEAWVRLPLT